MDKISLSAEKRSVLGRKVKNLRHNNILPANLYGKDIKSQAIQVNLADFEKAHKEAGMTGLVELILNKEKKPVLIHHIQKDPVLEIPIHADFLQVNLKQKVTANVPVELSGESPAEKQGLGTIVQYVNEIEVEALPTDLPEKFDVELAPLINVNDAIQIKSLEVDTQKIDVKNDPEQIIVKVEPLRKEEEIVPPPAPEAAVGKVPSEETVTTDGGEPSGVKEEPPGEAS